LVADKDMMCDMLNDYFSSVFTEEDIKLVGIQPEVNVKVD